MVFFNQFKEELDELQKDGNSIAPELTELVQKYSKQADKAEQILRKKQSIERDKRTAKAQELAN